MGEKHTPSYTVLEGNTIKEGKRGKKPVVFSLVSFLTNALFLKDRIIIPIRLRGNCGAGAESNQ